MKTKVIIDGALFSECQMFGSNRAGMHRLAEDITTELIKKKEVEVSLANTFYSTQYDNGLKNYVKEFWPSHSNRIVSRKPFFVSEIPKVKGLFNKIATRYKLEPTITGLGDHHIFHSFYYPFSPAVQQQRIKKTLTFLDIIPLRMDGYGADIIDKTKKIVEAIVPNFAIAISEFSREDLLDYNRSISADRVFAAQLAASPELFYKHTDAAEWQRIRQKYKLPDNYFLFISSQDRRKNTPHLIRCFEKFCLQQKPGDLSLLITGNSGYSRSLIEEMGIDKSVKDRIFVTDRHIENQDLAAVYSNAACFFFMSLYEGFGLPALEAMQCGTPVVAGKNSSITEVVGDGGILISATDEDALCESMTKMYNDSAFREQYAAAGFERSKQFSWEKCADKYTAIFNTIQKNF